MCITIADSAYSFPLSFLLMFIVMSDLCTSKQQFSFANYAMKEIFISDMFIVIYMLTFIKKSVLIKGFAIPGAFMVLEEITDCYLHFRCS